MLLRFKSLLTKTSHILNNQFISCSNYCCGVDMVEIIGWFLFSVFIFRLLRFATTPLLRKIGFYKYYSPMFMTMPWFFNSYDLHLGTSWDFAKQNEINPQRIMEFIAHGLINIAAAIENGNIKSNASFKGNTFYFKNDNIKKFGFKTRKMNLFESVLFALNYTELCILNSIVKRRLYFIPIKNVMIVTCKAKDIVQNKQKFELTMNILRKRNVQRFTKHKSISHHEIKCQNKNIGVDQVAAT